jgi:3',5'-cyclic AMP phosphodiesterase CpdA
MVIAQISDLHITVEGALAYGRVDTAGFLTRAIEQILHLSPRPDLVVATGDLVDGGRPEEYRRLRHLLSPVPMPVYLMPGNHDDRDALRSVFTDHDYLPPGGAFLHYAIDAGPLRLIALDTVVPGRAGGLMCEQRIEWLARRLDEASDRPVVIFMHHPPFKTGIEHMDRIGCAGADAMGRVVRKHRRIEHVLCGHLHRPIQTRWCGTIASTAPSTAHQVTLDLRRNGPPTFTMDPPAFLMHVWNDGGLVTHTHYVGDFAGPYSFSGS